MDRPRIPPIEESSSEEPSSEGPRIPPIEQPNAYDYVNQNDQEFAPGDAKNGNLD